MDPFSVLEAIHREVNKRLVYESDITRWGKAEDLLSTKRARALWAGELGRLADDCDGNAIEKAVQCWDAGLSDTAVLPTVGLCKLPGPAAAWGGHMWVLVFDLPGGIEAAVHRGGYDPLVVDNGAAAPDIVRYSQVAHLLQPGACFNVNKAWCLNRRVATAWGPAVAGATLVKGVA